jgi:hypothetical protein
VEGPYRRWRDLTTSKPRTCPDSRDSGLRVRAVDGVRYLADLTIGRHVGHDIMTPRTLPPIYWRCFLDGKSHPHAGYRLLSPSCSPCVPHHHTHTQSHSPNSCTRIHVHTNNKPTCARWSVQGGIHSKHLYALVFIAHTLRAVLSTRTVRGLVLWRRCCHAEQSISNLFCVRGHAVASARLLGKRFGNVQLGHEADY